MNKVEFVMGVFGAVLAAYLFIRVDAYYLLIALAALSVMGVIANNYVQKAIQVEVLTGTQVPEKYRLARGTIVFCIWLACCTAAYLNITAP
jgi:uncharacterized membrane protein